MSCTSRRGPPALGAAAGARQPAGVSEFDVATQFLFCATRNVGTMDASTDDGIDTHKTERIFMFVVASPESRVLVIRRWAERHTMNRDPNDAGRNDEDGLGESLRHDQQDQSRRSNENGRRVDERTPA